MTYKQVASFARSLLLLVSLFVLTAFSNGVRSELRGAEDSVHTLAGSGVRVILDTDQGKRTAT